MPAPLSFASVQEYASRRRDAAHWAPYVLQALRRAGLVEACGDVAPGFNPTFPTFLVGDLVVKLFGCVPGWSESYAAERGALMQAASEPDVPVPRLLAEGRLFEDAAIPWPYLVTARLPGASWRDADPSTDRRHALAAVVGHVVRRLHALEPPRALPRVELHALDVVAAAARSSLPPHLVSQVADYVGGLETSAPVFVHGDLVAAHVFVEERRVTGLIDWGDAAVADRHYELIQVYRDLFDCDRELLRVFLEASAWPVDAQFPRRALGQALLRQAMGLARHDGMDVFEPIAARFSLQEIGSLQELATLLFAV